MFIRHAEIKPARIAALRKAAEAAAHAIPPAFPLDATVAVNPFMGQADHDLPAAQARLARVAGVRLTQPRETFAAQVMAGTISDNDLRAALQASGSPDKPSDITAQKAQLATPAPRALPLPTLAGLAATSGGTDWPAIIARCFGLWAAGHFERGQALWTPAPGRDAFTAWREWASHDLTPEISGLTGFCAHVAAAPDTAERAILRACDALNIPDCAAETLFHRLLMDLGGWAQHARWLLWQAELAGNTDSTVTDLLAIRLIWEEALLAHMPELAQPWAQTCAAHSTPVSAGADHIIDAIFQDAAERAYQRKLAAALTGPKPHAGRATLQAAFCIDVRSEVFRRQLESINNEIETIGFAGFFGLPIAHKPHGTDDMQAHLPVLLAPALTSCSHADPAAEHGARIGARAVRAWGRFRQAAVSSFAFVESAGPIYGWKLLKSALARSPKPAPLAPAPRFETPLPPADKARIAATILRAMSLQSGHARLVLLLGHGAHVTNNPHASAYQCGACGGQSGEVSARLLAQLLNDPDTRSGLPAQGITLPDDTLFMAGLHDTTTDTVTLFHDTQAPAHQHDIAQAQEWLARASTLARNERAPRLPRATAGNLATRAADWAETRPEWGLAGCASFIAAPRAATAGADLGGRAFLHSYDWQADQGFSTLELILTAPVVVASWISLQYYASCVAPEAFGGGNKLIHNVVGGIGVVQGNGGILRPGLPWQAVHDGQDFIHTPLRLSVLIEAPQHAIADVLARHGAVRALFDNGWLHLLALENGRVQARYRPGLTWEGV
ncbi:YbcC family protein [Roseinatronobacter alkalisoli]|uniref:Probable inorganic carbon transporter subunit DabA n=1 Tax=Roseinatronobacter alkalisoli TaxID=3028235 RepID=A0ABT5T8Y2_9RHOB|nr:DUF2309 domain-containing protein [Roseinatronobacter sp. HJB301]MDD7971165.1 DUF2309 domain-containing protein [Roseinatronobacter sp. HJB301]